MSAADVATMTTIEMTNTATETSFTDDGRESWSTIVQKSVDEDYRVISEMMPVVRDTTVDAASTLAVNETETTGDGDGMVTVVLVTFVPKEKGYGRRYRVAKVKFADVDFNTFESVNTAVVNTLKNSPKTIRGYTCPWMHDLGKALTLAHKIDAADTQYGWGTQYGVRVLDWSEAGVYF